MTTTINEIDTILQQYPNAQRDALIPILQKIQDQFSYLSRDAVVQVGQHLNLPVSKIYGVATFYNQFRFQPLGQYHIQVCRGTACHVKGSAAVLKSLKHELGIEAGQTTRDGLFSLEIVACIGACGLAPVISVNGEFYASLTPEKVKHIIVSLQRKANGEDSNE
ncbi:MAG: NADH-quinone oxidoreductase subunit NuoE [Sedimentisphaerales bacterium]|nr:NADH-quinone oxidoreductase subunit NuoE [Sedimentisphaerales bacterium]